MSFGEGLVPEGAAGEARELAVMTIGEDREVLAVGPQPVRQPGARRLELGEPGQGSDRLGRNAVSVPGS
jgi:hypothetical protein